MLNNARLLASWPTWARRLFDACFVAFIGWQLAKAWWLWEEDSDQSVFHAVYATCFAALLWLAGRYDASLLLLVKLGALERPIGDLVPPTAPPAEKAVPESGASPGLERADLKRLAQARAYDGRFEPLMLLYATVAAAPLVTVGLALALLELPRPLELAVVGSGALASGAALSALRIPGWMRLALRLERRGE